MTDQSLAFAALGDPTRRAIFEHVAHRPQSVGKLAEHFEVSRPAVSQHLRVLKDAGLVRDQKDGTRRIYALELNGVMAMRTYLDRFWDQALSSFAAEANRDAEEEEETT